MFPHKQRNLHGVEQKIFKHFSPRAFLWGVGEGEIQSRRQQPILDFQKLST